jgi:hypothetical protein
MSVDVSKLIAERERKFIEQRVLITQWIKEFMESVHAFDPELLKGIKIPEGRTAEELLPSLFIEPFDHAAYLREREAMEDLRGKVNAVAEKLNEEALACLQQLKVNT